MVHIIVFRFYRDEHQGVYPFLITKLGIVNVSNLTLFTHRVYSVGTKHKYTQKTLLSNTSGNKDITLEWEISLSSKHSTFPRV